MVRRPCPGFTVEEGIGYGVGGVGVGDHVAADTGESSEAVLGEVDERLA